jgi:hypothetical protein
MQPGLRLDDFTGMVDAPVGGGNRVSTLTVSKYEIARAAEIVCLQADQKQY